MSKFLKCAILKSSISVDWNFSDNENKHKNLHRILDDDDGDDDLLNTCSLFTMNKIFYDDNNNNPLDDDKYDHGENIINSEYYLFISRIKN